VAEVEHLTPNQRAWLRFKRNHPAVLGLAFLVVFLGILTVWPFMARIGPNTLSDDQFQPPSAKHWCGTDVHGRDLLARIIYGARISLLVGAVGTLVSLVIGVAWGAVAGYVGGKIDEWMMRTVDILYSLPSIIFVIVLITTLEELLKNWANRYFGTDMGTTTRLLFLFFGLGAVSWLTMARIVRGQVLSLRTRSFVYASQTLGATHAHIIWRHILPNVFGVVIVYLTLTVPSVVLYESFLSYLGLGIQPPMASWGSLIAEGAEQLNAIRIYWWLLVFPCVAMVLTLLALNFLGDGLRDAYDPRGRAVN
jgi:peptide/nickel transport system permease protein/oligopeptide transport system permease protein